MARESKRTPLSENDPAGQKDAQAEKARIHTLDNNMDYVLLERALHASQNGILITDSQQRDNPIIWCNPGFLRLTGYTPSEVLGRNCRFLQGKETDPETIRILRECVMKGTDCRVEILNYRKDGSSFLNGLHISPIRDDKGVLTHFVGIQSEVPDSTIADDLEKIRAYAASIVDTVREPILILDRDLRVITANLSFYRMFRVKPQEVEGILLYELGSGQWDIPALKTLLNEILPRHNFFRDFEVTHLFPRIGRKTMLLNARSVGSQEDQPERILLAIEDVTHQQGILEASVDFARGIVDALSAHIAILDETGVIVAVNEAWNRFAELNGGDATGTSAFVGVNYLEICRQSDGECAGDALVMAEGMRSILAGDAKSFEHEYPCHAPHEKRWFIGRVTSFTYAEKLYLVVAHENVTTRKVSEMALHQSEERYRHLVENADEYAILTLDTAGTLTGWNHGAELIFGYTEKEIRGQSAQCLFTPEDVAAGTCEGEMKTAEVNGKASDSRYMQRKDGTRFYAEGTLFALYDDTRHLIGFGKLLRDFTERHNYQQSIEHLNERLKRAMTETHHRVRNNLQLISAMIDLEILNSTDAPFQASLRRLNGHVQTMATVHDMLTYAARSKQQVDEISVQDILERLVATVTQLAGKRRIVATLQDIALPIQQGTSLAIVTNELLMNALKHGQHEVHVTVEKREKRATLTVTDDGPGFPVGFSPDRETTGLELISGLVALDLKGEIVFGNRSDRSGACVTVHFPLLQPG